MRHLSSPPASGRRATDPNPAPMTDSARTPGLTYAQAGVDIDAGDRLVENIKPLARRTLREGVLAEVEYVDRVQRKTRVGLRAYPDRLPPEPPAIG